jgi:hypothetical protein
VVDGQNERLERDELLQTVICSQSWLIFWSFSLRPWSSLGETMGFYNASMLSTLSH